MEERQKPCLGSLAPATSTGGASTCQQALVVLSDQGSLGDTNSNRGQLGAIVRDDASSHSGSEAWAHEGFAAVARSRPESWFPQDPESATIPPTSIATVPSTPSSSARTVTPRMTPRLVTAGGWQLAAGSRQRAAGSRQPLNAAPPSWQHPLAAKQAFSSSSRRVTAKLHRAASSADRTKMGPPPAAERGTQRALSATSSHPVLPRTRRVTARAVHVPCSVATIKDGSVDAADDGFWTNVLSTSPLKWEARVGGISSARVSQKTRVTPTGVGAGAATTGPVPLLALPASGSSSIQPPQPSAANTGVGCNHTMWASRPATSPSSSRNSSRCHGGVGLQGGTSWSAPLQNSHQGDGHGPMWVSLATPPNSTRRQVGTFDVHAVRNQA